MLQPREPKTYDEAILYAIWQEQKKTNELLEKLIPAPAPEPAPMLKRKGK